MDRKSYSKKRETALYSIVDEVLIQVRIDMLRGNYRLLNSNEMEERFYNATASLGQEVCAEYRKSYAPQTEPKRNGAEIK